MSMVHATVKYAMHEGSGRYKCIDVDACLNAARARPGMYVNIHIADTQPQINQYCVVMATTASSTTFMFDATSRFGSSINGDTRLIIDEPMGGFNIDDVVGRDVVCFAGGSGIAGIFPVVSAIACKARHIDVLYCESNDGWARFAAFDTFTNVIVHHIKTEGVLHANEHEPILGMLSQLAGIQPKVFLNHPIFYACGPTRFVKRLNDALVPAHAQQCDFRLNF